MTADTSAAAEFRRQQHRRLYHRILPCSMMLSILSLWLISLSSSATAFSTRPRISLRSSLVRKTPLAMMSTMPSSASSSDNIAIVGCGVLGTFLCKQLLSHPQFASCSITGITKSTSRHEAIRREVLGVGHAEAAAGGGEVNDRFQLVTMEEVLASTSTFRDVVFCAPPSGFEDYPSAIESAATRLWTGIPNHNGGEGEEEVVGSFVFTSSGAVYEGIDGETVDELSPTVSDATSSPRAYRMVQAENAAIQQGGCALRLAGLYTLERGAHNYWLDTSGTAKGRKTLGRGDGIVNLLHYEDAASAVLAAILVGPKVNSGKTFLISDGNPTTRRGICESAMKHSRYRECATMPPFLEVEKDGMEEAGPRGKVYDGRKSNEALGWKPKYSSFDEFMTL